MNEETYRQRLDLYYLATIVYGATLIAYVAVKGLWVDDRFELVWKDPIVYLLAACAIAALLALIVAAVINRKVVVRPDEIILRTRFSDRIIRAMEVEAIVLRPEPRAAARARRAWPRVAFRIRNRRRPRRLRPGGFEQSEKLVRAIGDWAHANHVQLFARRRRSSRHNGGQTGDLG